MIWGGVAGAMGNRPSMLTGPPATRATTMKIRRGKFSGTIGDVVYVNTQQGQVVRSRPRRAPRETAGRERARANLAGVASQWRTLSNPRFAAWAAAARKEGMPPTGSSAKSTAPSPPTDYRRCWTRPCGRGSAPIRSGRWKSANGAG